jgi:enamine deaminase RidA (YjgF/YER057c/UK114 family)
VTENDQMEITRHGIVIGSDGQPLPLAPVISWAVARGDVVHLSGITDNPRDPAPNVRSQTRRVLARIDELLAEVGTSKSKLLTAQVWLADMAHLHDLNEEWNAWVDRENPPTRACIQAGLVSPDLLVEIMVTAAR